MIKTKNMKKLWLVAALAVLFAVLFCVSAGAETYNGTCGAVSTDTEFTWSLDTVTGELVISGTGRMENYTDPTKAPWISHSDSIKKVTIENGVTSIGRWAFANCSAFTEIALPESLTAISYGAFEGCAGLTSIELPNSLTSINYGAFMGCKALAEVAIPESVTVLEGKAFADCSSLTKVTIPEGVTSLAWGIFDGCSKLAEVNIHENIEIIDAYAFQGCDALTEVTIHKGVKHIGQNSFKGCDSLTSITVVSKTTVIGGTESTIPESTTIYAEPNSGAKKYVDEFGKNAVIVCTHQSKTKTILKAPTCTKSGTAEIICDDCDDYYEVIILAPSHNDEAVDTTLGFTEYTCKACGDSGMIVRAGETLKLSAFCKGELSFSLAAGSAADALEVLVDGSSIGNVAFSDDGTGTVEIKDLASAGHTVEFVNKSRNDIRIKNDSLDGYFHRADTVYDEGVLYLEMLGKEGLDYSDFYVYVRTSDSSENYYVRYKFDYQHNPNLTTYEDNSATNLSNYRINGATLVKITGVSESTITADEIRNVLGGGEVSLAIRQANQYHIPEGADAYIYNQTNAPNQKDVWGQCIEHVGGFHGDEWLDVVSLVADDKRVELKTSEHSVIACSALRFDQISTMFAWGTSGTGLYEDERGLPFAEHIQNFAINSTGINHMQTIKWLRDDFEVGGGYMPMFTMLRGSSEDRFIDTMRSYDDDGKLVETYKMTSDMIENQTNVLYDYVGGSIAAYEYDGPCGISARVDFREANDHLTLASWIALRTDTSGSAPDNKMYASFSKMTAPDVDVVWMVESHYMIDYDSAKIQ